MFVVPNISAGFMNVSQSNFEAMYSEILGLQSSCEFISIATELSGREVYEETPDKWTDEPQERYTRLIRLIDTYELVQVGLCFFVRDGENLVAKPYNFYVFPHSPGGASQVSARLVLLEPRVVSRLKRMHFDFNRWTTEGLCSMQREEEAKERASLEAEETKINAETNPRPPSELDLAEELPQKKKILVPKDQAELTRLTGLIDAWVASDSDEMMLPDMNPFMMRLVSDLIKTSYKASSSSSLPLPHAAAAASAAASSPPSYDCRNRCVKFETRPSRTDSYRREVWINRLSAEVKRERLTMALRERSLNFAKRSALRRLWALVTQWKLPVVGHDLLLDLMVLIHRCEESLPFSLADFNTLAHSLVPFVHDTHILINNIQNARTSPFFLSWDLADVYLHLQNTSKLVWSVASGIQHYEKSRMLAEAGFRATMAGVVFASCIDNRLANMLMLKNSLYDIALDSKQDVTAQHHTNGLTLILKARGSFHPAQITTLFKLLDETFQCGTPIIHFDSTDIAVVIFFSSLVATSKPTAKVEASPIADVPPCLVLDSVAATQIPAGFSVPKFIRAIKKNEQIEVEIWSCAGSLDLAVSMEQTKQESKQKKNAKKKKKK